MSLSAVPAAKLALLAQLRARIPVTTASVFYGRPNVDPSPTLNVYLEGATSTQEWAHLGRRARNETFTLTVAIDAFHGGTDAQAAEADAWAVADLVSLAVLDDHTLGGTVRHALPAASIEQTQEPFQDGHVVRIRVSVDADAHLNTP